MVARRICFADNLTSSFRQVELQESNDFLHTLLDNITSAIFIVDTDLKIQSFNNSFKSIFLNEYEKFEPGLCGNVLGCMYAVEENVDCGKTTNCETCDLRNALLMNFVEKVPVYKSKMVRNFYLNGDKVLKYLQYTAKYIEYKDQEMVLVVVDDITRFEEQKKELEDLNSSKDRFLSILAHDLKAPLNSLSGFSDMIVNYYDHLEKTEIIELGRQLEGKVANMKRLLKHLLDWARSKTGGLDFNFEPVELTSLVQESFELFKSTAEDKDIDFQFNNREKIVALCDYNSVDTIIRNLISNAIKFTHRGGQVIIEVQNGSEDVRVSVKDTGMGISEEAREKIFSINGNYSTKGTANEEGTGLGLVMCKEFANKNKGDLQVESKLEKGSTFTLCLPAGGYE